MLVKKITLLLVVTVGITTASASTQRGQYAEGRLLAKFKPGITLKADITPKNTGIAMLDSLNNVYRCSKLEPLIPRTKNDNPNKFFPGNRY